MVCLFSHFTRNFRAGHRMRLEKILEILKRTSIFLSGVSALCFLLLNFIGISLFVFYYSVLGAEPFQFSLKNCLENGVMFLSDMLVALPVMLLLGALDIHNTAEIGVRVLLFAIPIGLWVIVILTYKRHSKYLSAIGNSLLFIFMVFASFLLLLIYYTYLTNIPQNLLTESDVNLALQHKQQLLDGAKPADFGISKLEGMSLNMVIKDDEWRITQAGTILMLGGIGITYAIIGLWTCGQALNLLVGSARKKLTSVLNVQRAILFGCLVFFSAVYLYIGTGMVSTLCATCQMRKVDAAIEGLEQITSKNYFLLVGERDDSYTFHLPTDQQLVRVPKSLVKHLIIKGRVSLFADRFWFRKGPWLGVKGEWKENAVVSKTDAKQVDAILFCVSEVIPNSPADDAGVKRDDLILKVNNTVVTQTYPLSSIIERLPVSSRITLKIIRQKAIHNIPVQLREKP